MIESDAALSAESLHHLRATKPWVRFISVMLWIAAVLFILGTVFLLLGVGASPELPAGVGLMMGVIYAGFSAIYVFLALYLGRYASGIGNLLVEPKAQNLDYALKAQKSFWTLAGVMTLISVIVGVLGIVAAIVMGVAAGVNPG